MLASCFVKTIEDLKQLDWNCFDVVTTLGYSIVGKGGATYFKDNSTYGSPNEVSVIQAYDGNTVKLSHNGQFNLYHCGAIGDGITDDTVALQRALNTSSTALTCSPGSGRFRISSKVTSYGKPLNFIGAGISNTVFLCESPDKTLDVQPGNILNAVQISNMSFVANNSTEQTGCPISVIWPTTPSWAQKTFILDDVGFVSNLAGSTLPNFKQGLYLKNAWNARITNLFDNGQANTFNSTCGSSIILGENCTDVQITGLHSFFRYISVLVEGYIEGLTIDKAVMVAVNKGFQNTANSILGPRIINSHINAQSMCIDILNASQPQISNNLLYTAINNLGVTNIQLVGVTDGQVTSNSMLSSNPQSNGITLVNSGAIVSARNDLLDNDMQGHGTGIWLKVGTQGNKVKRNTRYVSGIEQTAVYDQGTSNTITT